ncbi:MAG: hypothetical protein WC119_03445 [Synergistaceae bacterium]
MKASHRKTIEEISISQMPSDLWDELYKDKSSQVILSFREGAAYEMRLLGSFVGGSRIFLDPKHKFNEIMRSSELVEIIKGNSEVKSEIEKKILNSTPDVARRKLHVESINDININHPQGKMILDKIDVIYNLHTKKNWQSVVFSNATILRANVSFPIANPAIICLSRNLSYQLLGEIVSKSKNREEALKKTISGLNAHDVLISRKGKGLHSKYTITISDEPASLPAPLISFIIKEGLWDIKKITNISNKKVINGKLTGFIYRINDRYRASSDLMAEIFSQAQDIDDAEYMDCIEDNLAELPPEALELDDKENTIGSLEL